MIKILSNYALKVPGEQDYSSKSFMASVEIELPAGLSGPEIQEKIHETFNIVRQSVENEISGNGKTVQANESRQRASHAEGNASNKQVGYLLDLAKARDIPLMQLNADVQKRFSAASVYELSRRDCSRLIDEFQRAA